MAVFLCMTGSNQGERLTLNPAQRYSINDAMKALTIPASCPSMRERMRFISATLSNLRARIDARACLTVAIVATVAFFFALGMMHFPTIIASGLTSLTCAALAPIDKKGGKS